jgi:hypothetical protein
MQLGGVSLFWHVVYGEFDVKVCGLERLSAYRAMTSGIWSSSLNI